MMESVLLDVGGRGCDNARSAPRWLLVLGTIALLTLGSVAPAQASPGSLDRDFGRAGKVLTPLGATRSEWFASAVQMVHANDRDLLVANSASVARYRPDGGLDPSFGQGGIAAINPPEGAEISLAGVAVDSRGRVLLAGTATFPAQPNSPSCAPSCVGFESMAPEYPILLRYLPNGSPDPAFGDSRGALVTSLGLPSTTVYSAVSGEPAGSYQAPRARVTGLAIDGADRITLTGNVLEAIGHCGTSIALSNSGYLARLSSEGALDPSFGGRGVVIDARLESIGAPRLSSEGDVVFAGEYGGECKSPSVVGIGRRSANGSLDGAFGQKGWRKLDLGGIADLAIDGRGQAFVLGGTLLAGSPGAPVPSKKTAEATFAPVLKLTPDGKVDRRYGRAGKTLIRLPGRRGGFNRIAVDPWGRALLAGTLRPSPRSPGAHSLLALSRLTPSGTADQSFGTGGRVVTGFGKRASAVAAALTIDRQRIIVAGPASSPSFPSGVGLALAGYDIGSKP